MREVKQATKFDRDFRRELKGKHGNLLAKVFISIVETLAKDEPLPEKYRDHALSGEWKEHRDCHIKPDLVLIYRKEGSEILRLFRLGSHSELGI